ncbi:WecB/TagA/CpsF family glycosyltransferase [Leptolyngbyaceae cyanobacterium UHCC 1019]
MKSAHLNVQSLKVSPRVDVNLLGRRITFMTAETIVAAIASACLERKKIIVANYNVHSFNLSVQLPWFYSFLQDSDIVHCDGMGILKAARFMGEELPIEYRASYTILMPKLLEYCDHNNLSIFLLGSKPKYLQAALVQMRQQYPNIKVAGHHGYFQKEDAAQNEAIVQQINSMKPNILIVGMGMPIQEHWIQQHRDRLDVNVIMPGGAVIDRLAGAVLDCPTVLSNMGLEWLYRLYKEPKRLAVRYLLGNPAFVLQVLLYRFTTFSANIRNSPASSSSRVDSSSLNDRKSVVSQS